MRHFVKKKKAWLKIGALGTSIFLPHQEFCAESSIKLISLRFGKRLGFFRDRIKVLALLYSIGEDDRRQSSRPK